jgi:hypothetical protein
MTTDYDRSARLLTNYCKGKTKTKHAKYPAERVGNDIFIKLSYSTRLYNYISLPILLII